MSLEVREGHNISAGDAYHLHFSLNSSMQGRHSAQLPTVPKLDIRHGDTVAEFLLFERKGRKFVLISIEIHECTWALQNVYSYPWIEYISKITKTKILNAMLKLPEAGYNDSKKQSVCTPDLQDKIFETSPACSTAGLGPEAF